MLVFQDQYSHIIPITAKASKTAWGLKENHFCDKKHHVMYDLGKRAFNPLLKQLSELTTFSKFEMQQVSTKWKKFKFISHSFLHSAMFC